MIGMILLGAVVVCVFWGIGTYNHFVTLSTRSEEAWADIETQLKRRYDLIPNLVETVKGYAKHEDDVLTKVIEARSAAISGGHSPEAVAAGENGMAGALKNLFAVAEAYPDLKANQNFLELQRELTDTEDKIQAARRFYNGNVRDLNTGIDMFPGNFVASWFHFAKRSFFDLPDNDAAQEPVAVKF